MKIAYILDKYPKISETFIINEILSLRQLGDDIKIFPLAVGDLENFDKNDVLSGVKYHPYIKSSRSQLFSYIVYKIFTRPIALIKTFYFLYKHKEPRLIKLFYRALVLSKAIEAEDVLHIHAHFAGKASLMAMVVSFITGFPYSLTTHAYDIYLMPKMIYDKHKYAKFAVTISDYNKKNIVDKYGVDSNKIHVVRCGIDTALFKPKKYEKTQNPVFQIVAVGRLVEKKGFEYLIKACALFKEKYGDCFECRIIGGGILFERLSDMISGLNLSKNVYLLGEIKHSELFLTLNTCDLFALPCVKAKNGDIDGIPVSLMEAMAMGIVIISTSISGIPELIEDNTLLVSERDEQGLFKSIEAIYNMGYADKNAIGIRQRHKIETCFNLSKEARKLSDLFNLPKRINK